MIVPATDKLPTVKRPKVRNLLYVYHTLAIVLNLATFIPFITAWASDDSNPISKENQSVYQFRACCILSIPLVFEFCLDTLVSALYPVYQHNQMLEHKFGHSLVVFSLALPAILSIINAGSNQNSFSMLLCSCFINACQSLAIGGILGKLQVFGRRDWGFLNSLVILSLYCASQMVLNFGIATCNGNKQDVCEIPQVYTFVSLALAFLCTKGFALCCKPYMFEYQTNLSFTSSQYTSYILLIIVGCFFLARLVLLALYLGEAYGTGKLIELEIMIHIALGLCATVLPGRMIRRGMVAMQHEMDNKKTFVRYISHEIRSPLSTTCLGLDYLIDQLDTRGVKKATMTIPEILDVIKDTKITCEVATNTLNDLLMFDKIENGMLEITPTEVDAWEFVNDCVRPFNLQAMASGIAMRVKYLGFTGEAEEIQNFSERNSGRISGRMLANGTAGGMISQMLSTASSSPREEFDLTIKVDKHKMDQVVRNLLTNALKFSPQHSRANISIDVSLQHEFTGSESVSGSDKKKSGSSSPKKRSGESRYREDEIRNKVIRITFTDNGPGISKENLPKLFGQYVQFDANNLQGGKGSGLGLWLSKAIVEMHGGVIGATSNGLGKGSSFFFEIPCVLSHFCLLPSTRDLACNSNDSRTLGSSKTNLLDRVSDTGSQVLPYLNVSDRVEPFIQPEEEDFASPGRGPQTFHFKELDGIAAKTQQYQQLVRLDRPDSPKKPIDRQTEKPVERQQTDKLTEIHVDTRQDSPKKPVTISAKEKSLHLANNVAELKDNLPRPAHTRKPSAHSTKPQLNQQTTYGLNSKELPRKPGLVDGTNFPLTDLRVLLVDDSNIARKMVERMLSAVGCVCDHACNGQEAVEKVAVSMSETLVDYDVILMDCYMPVLSGPDAVKVLRDRGFKGLILAVTGSATDGEFAPLLAQGLVERIVIKPFNAEDFREIIYENKHSSRNSD